MPVKRRGLTEFTYSRFLVPYLCNYAGTALFLDADMVVTGDIAELFATDMSHHQVLVNKAQAEFEWASAMLFDCSSCVALTPEYVKDNRNALFDFKWAEHGAVGAFAPEWNQVCGYGETLPDAKLYHFTRGLPIWKETKGLPEDRFFHEAYKAMLHSCSYEDLMGSSVHAATQRDATSSRVTGGRLACD